MPANSKYLEKFGWQRFAKITAGVIGGFAVSASFFVLLAVVLKQFQMEVLITFYFGGFLLWIPLMMIAFLFRNGWKCLLLYCCVSLAFSIGSVIW